MKSEDILPVPEQNWIYSIARFFTKPL